MNRLVFGLPARGRQLASLRDAVLRRSRRYRACVDGVLDRNLAIARAVLEVTKKEVFFDASKNPRIAARLAERSDVDLRLIQLVRDPRAVLHSTLKRNRAVSLELVGRHWLRTHRGAQWVARSMPRRSCFRLNYETLCEAPEETLASLCRFLGTEPRDLVRAAASGEHHLIGNDMRKTRFQAVRLDDSWRERLSAAQADRIARMTRPLGRSLGYEI